MIVAPMVRNNICMNAHPGGCARAVDLDIERVKADSADPCSALARAGSGPGPRAVLVIGSSTGYGLASRIVAAFGYRAATVGFSYEKEPTASRVGTPGWYANRAFDGKAAAAGLKSLTFNVDAFSHEAKAMAVKAAHDLGIRFDLVIYSLASPVRVDPDTGEMYRSVIKPIGKTYAGRNVDVFSGTLSEAVVQPADDREIAQTVKVMGGEDWASWIDALGDAGVLAEKAVTLAYSYLGPEMSWPIYRDGTIGRAKAHLETASADLNRRRGAAGLAAYVSVNKALVTRASAVIPVIPLYVSTLFKVMKERGIHEDCLDQAERLFGERLYRADGSGPPVDPEGRIRLDELEMGAAVQAEVASRLARTTAENLRELADIDGFRTDFLRAHGFEVPGIDYSAEVDPLA